MTMGTKKTNISSWLHSFQYIHETYGNGFGTTDEYVFRISRTGKKINSILNTLYEAEEKFGVNLTPYHDSMQDMLDIRNAIGVYGIYHPNHSRRQYPYSKLWYKEEPASEHSSSYKEGSYWLDYFGLNKGITNAGGYVVVSLSTSGILYLNGIAKEVASLTTVTV